MSNVHLHLKNLPHDAVNLDIRRFFIDFDIPEGGVHIVGGPEGEAFVTFSTYEDLIKAASYDKRPFFGRQLLLNLVNNYEIEKIIETIKYELAANVTPQPMDIPPARQMSPRREHAWARSPLRDFSPPREPTRVSGTPKDLPWQKRSRPATPPWPHDDSIFAGLESKRMRLSDQTLDDGRYSRADPVVDRDRVGIQEREKLRMELEKERQRNQDIEDELRRNKERIERLERGIVEKDITTLVRNQDEPRRPQIDEWDRRQPEEPRYQREEVRAQAEVYQDIPRRPIEEPPRFDRFDKPEPRFDSPPPAPRYSMPAEGYGRPAEGYGRPDEGYGRPDEGYGRPDEGYGRDNMRYREPSPQRPGIDERRRERSPLRNQPQRMRDQGRGRSISPERRQGSTINYSPPGYVMVSNLDSMVTYKEIRRFFDGYLIVRGGIILQPTRDPTTSTAYVKFVNLDDALNCDRKDHHLLHGREVRIEMISPVDYDAQRNPEEVREKNVFVPPPKLNTRPREEVAPTPLRVGRPNTGRIEQALYFISLKFLPEDATACSVWEEFGGSLGRSVGVLMLVEQKEKQDRNWYVAFENCDDRDAELPLHEGSRAFKDKSVYRKLANVKAAKLYRSTRTGEDVEISYKDQSILKQRFLLKEFVKQQQQIYKSERDFEDEQMLMNKMSRSLLALKRKENSGERIAYDQSQSYYLRLVRLPPDASAREVRSWFKGSAGSCSSVTLTSKPDEELGKLKIGYVAFNDPGTRSAEKAKYKLSRNMTEQAALRCIARSSFNPDVEILKATDTVDEVMSDDDRKAMQKEWFPNGLDVQTPDTESTQSVPKVSAGQPSKTKKEALHFLQIKKIKPDMSCASVWQWFGGKKGPAEGVTLMETDGSCIAFVAFRDLEKRAEAKRNQENSETIDEDQMLRKLANCSPNHMIFRSSIKGPNGMMSKAERAELKAKVYPGSRKDSEDGENIKKSEDKKKSGDPETGGSAKNHPPGTKFFLRIFNLPEDATACEVWSWLGGPTGSSTGVTMVHRFEETGDTKYAFVEFTDWEVRNQTKLKYPNSKGVNERQVLRALALCGVETEILQSTESGVDRALSVEERDVIKNTIYPNGFPSTEQKPQQKLPIQHPTNDRRLTVDKPKLLLKHEPYEYMRLTDLKPAISAFTINTQYRPCRGVTLIKNAFGQAVLAFVAFTKKSNPKATTWQKSRDRELASLELDFEIYENTMKSKDRKITPAERQEFLHFVQTTQNRQRNMQRFY